MLVIIISMRALRMDADGKGKVSAFYFSRKLGWQLDNKHFSRVPVTSCYRLQCSWYNLMQWNSQDSKFRPVSPRVYSPSLITAHN